MSWRLRIQLVDDSGEIQEASVLMMPLHWVARLRLASRDEMAVTLVKAIMEDVLTSDVIEDPRLV